MGRCSGDVRAHRSPASPCFFLCALQLLRTAFAHGEGGSLSIDEMLIALNACRSISETTASDTDTDTASLPVPPQPTPTPEAETPPQRSGRVPPLQRGPQRTPPSSRPRSAGGRRGHPPPRPGSPPLRAPGGGVPAPLHQVPSSPPPAPAPAPVVSHGPVMSVRRLSYGLEDEDDGRRFVCGRAWPYSRLWLGHGAVVRRTPPPLTPGALLTGTCVHHVGTAPLFKPHPKRGGFMWRHVTSVAFHW